jgi:hypothetical protein
MRHFMPNGVYHQFFEVRRIPGHTFVRALKDDDLIGHDEAIGYASLRQRPPAIEAQQRLARRDAPRPKLLR